MATYTNNLILTLPALDDAYDIEQFNSNFRKIDTKYKELDDRTKNLNVDLVDTQVRITDAQNKFTSTKLDGVLNELDDKANRKANSTDLVDNKITVNDYYNYFTSTTLDGVLNELYVKAGTGQTGPTTLPATSITYADGTTNLGATNVQNAIGKIVDKMKVQYVETTLMSNYWNMGTYSLEANYPSTTYDVEVELSGKATKEQAMAWGKVIPVPNENGQNIIKALGTTPTVNIPVRLKVVKK